VKWTAQKAEPDLGLSSWIESGRLHTSQHDTTRLGPVWIVSIYWCQRSGHPELTQLIQPSVFWLSSEATQRLWRPFRARFKSKSSHFRGNEFRRPVLCAYSSHI